MSRERERMACRKEDKKEGSRVRVEREQDRTKEKEKERQREIKMETMWRRTM